MLGKQYFPHSLHCHQWIVKYVRLPIGLIVSLVQTAVCSVWKMFYLRRHCDLFYMYVIKATLQIFVWMQIRVNPAERLFCSHRAFLDFHEGRRIWRNDIVDVTSWIYFYSILFLPWLQFEWPDITAAFQTDETTSFVLFAHCAEICNQSHFLLLFM